MINQLFLTTLFIWCQTQIGVEEWYNSVIGFNPTKVGGSESMYK